MIDKRQIQSTGCAVVTVTVGAINGFRGEPRQIPVTLHIGLKAACAHPKTRVRFGRIVECRDCGVIFRATDQQNEVKK